MDAHVLVWLQWRFGALYIRSTRLWRRECIRCALQNVSILDQCVIRPVTGYRGRYLKTISSRGANLREVSFMIYLCLMVRSQTKKHIQLIIIFRLARKHFSFLFGTCCVPVLALIVSKNRPLWCRLYIPPPGVVATCLQHHLHLHETTLSTKYQKIQPVKHYVQRRSVSERYNSRKIGV